MNAIEREYHHFGPWLLEIKNETEMPRQYNDKKELILNAKFSFKAPVNRDYSHMRAGMLLYKSVISIFEDRVMIFSIENDKMDEAVILFKNIEYLIQGGELLSNYIHISTGQGEYTISYHSVSHEITSKVIGMIREGMLRGVPQKMVETIDNDDFYRLPLYKSLQVKEAIDVPLKVLAHQPRTKVKVKSVEKKTNLINFFKWYKLKEILVITNYKEIIIASSDLDRKKKGTVDYSHRYIYINTEGIINIEVFNNEVLEGVKDLVFTVGNKKIRLKVMESFSPQMLFLLIKNY